MRRNKKNWCSQVYFTWTRGWAGSYSLGCSSSGGRCCLWISTFWVGIFFILLGSKEWQ